MEGVHTLFESRQMQHYIQHYGAQFSFALAVFFVWVLGGFETAGFLAVFFILGCGCGGGDSDGDDCGNGSPSSTPFLCTWNGSTFKFDNDFLLGGASTLFPNFEIGQKNHVEGNVHPDLYNITNKFSFKNKKIAFQIKEIEPEESFIDHLSLTRVLYPKTGELIVDARHKDFYVFGKEELLRKEGVEKQRIYSNKKDIIDFLTTNNVPFEEGEGTKDEYMLEAGESVEIHGTLQQPLKTSSTFLLVGSRYRDWAVSEILELEQVLKESTPSPFWKQRIVALPKVAGRIMLMFFFATIVWVIGIVDNPDREAKKGSHNDNALLAKAFGIPQANAGVAITPVHSLVIAYWDWDEKKFKKVHIIQPRSIHTTVEAIALPTKRAINANGEVRVRITATKRHALNFVSFFVSKKKYTLRTEKLTLSRVFHSRLQKECATVLQEKQSGGYLHTIPGDVVDIEFTTPIHKRTIRENEAYLWGSVGFYTPLSKEGARRAGNWVDALDRESRARLSKMYALRSYYMPDRETIL